MVSTICYPEIITNPHIVGNPVNAVVDINNLAVTLVKFSSSDFASWVVLNMYVIRAPLLPLIEAVRMVSIYR